MPHMCVKSRESVQCSAVQHLIMGTALSTFSAVQWEQCSAALCTAHWAEREYQGYTKGVRGRRRRRRRKGRRRRRRGRRRRKRRFRRRRRSSGYVFPWLFCATLGAPHQG